MTVRRTTKSAAGFTLVEIMIAIVILTVAVIGTSNFRYYAAADARKAGIHIMAARIGLLLCENWRGVMGDETFDPVTSFSSELTITEDLFVTESEKDEYQLGGFTFLGRYKVVVNNINYYVILLWKDVSTGLRALNITVAWPPRGEEGAGLTGAEKLFQLTTYTSTD